MKSTRREFFARTGCTALSAFALQAGFRQLGLINLFAQEAAPTDYRALVCIFMDGGNDSNNLVIPNDTTRYTQYFNIRNPNGLAIQQANLLPINSASSGAWGFHPSLGIGFPAATPYPTVHQLYGAGKVAVVGNVGTLVYPMSRTTYLNNTVPKPNQLFSHSDQVSQQLTARPDLTSSQRGWGGRLADRLLSLNGGSGFPLVTSVSGTSVFGVGASTRPLSIGTGALNNLLVLNGFTTSADDMARRSAYDVLRTLDRQAMMIKATGDMEQQAVDIGAAFSTDPALTTQFPATGLGRQLQQVAKIMKLNQTSPALSLNRQIFLARIGGFDTHQNEISSHTSLFQQLAQAMASFYQATIELGISDRVTTFTLSDFGRTLQPSGSGAGVVGTDHAWASHHLVMGGAVVGGNMYGVTNPANGTVMPELVLGAPDSIDNRGRMVPTTALDQYASTLALWFGLPPTDLSLVFPNIGHFTTTNLGFMG